MSLFLGIDIGTSGVRCCVIDQATGIVAETGEPIVSEPMGEGVDAEGWIDAAAKAIARLPAVGVEVADITALSIDGTSGSMVLVDTQGTPVTPGLLYNSKGFEDEAARIAEAAPAGSIVQGQGSALARLLRLQKLAEAPVAHLCHQADFLAARLIGRTGTSDESNGLKTGYDARQRRWPDWLAACGVSPALLPKVEPVGEVIGTAGGDLASQLGFAPSTQVVAGATDSVAAFLSAGVRETGVAVTSLGTTLAIKVLSDAPVEDAARGIYSHRIGDQWLPGGASNTGGGVLLQHFSADEMAALSETIDPAWTPKLDLYPLPRSGERFPRNNPNMVPVNGPRPDDDAEYLFELFHAIARIEREGYEALRSLGAPYPTTLLTAGGGGRNPVWTAIRERVLGVPVRALENVDAAFGMALTARRAILP